MSKIFINIPVEASTHKYPAMFPYPLLILNQYQEGDRIVDLVLSTFKKNSKAKKSELDNIISEINNNKFNGSEIIINCGEYAPDGYYSKWVEYFLKNIKHPVQIMGPYATCFKNKIKHIIEKTKIQHETLDIRAEYDTYNVKIPDYMLLNYPKVNNKIKANMRISLGCPRNCLQCPVGIIYNHQYVYYPIDPSIEIIKYYYSKGVRVINFIDDNISGNIARFAQFLLELKKLNYKDMRYYVQEGFEVLAFHNEEVCKLLKELKFQDIKIGVENIKDDFLEKIGKKHFRFSDIEIAVANIKKYKLNTKFFFLLSQFQPKEDIVDNLRYFADTGVDLRVNIIREYEGNKLEKIKERISLQELRKLKSLAYASAWMSTVQKFNIFQENALEKYLINRGYIFHETDNLFIIDSGKQYFGFKTSKWITALEYMLQQVYSRKCIKIEYDKENKVIKQITLKDKE